MKTLNPTQPLHSEGGAFDLPSILTGVVVVGVLTAGVLGSVFGVIPYAQDNGAKQDLSAVRTAQGAAKAQKGAFLNQSGLSASGLVGNLGSGIAVTSSSGSEFCATSTSATGKFFSITESMSEPVESNLCGVWTIPDPVLRAAVAAKVSATAPGIAPASFVTSSADGSLPMIRTAEETPVELTFRDAVKLTSLDVSGTGVTSLEGLQYATGLKTLCLNDTTVSDLSPLAGINGLTTLCMNNTPVTSVAPLADHADLVSLEANGTTISNWKPVRSVPNVDAPWNLDPALNARFLAAMGLPADHVLTVMEARDLYGEQDLQSTSASDYSGLEEAVNASFWLKVDSADLFYKMQNVPNLTAVTLAWDGIDLANMPTMPTVTRLNVFAPTTISDLSLIHDKFPSLTSLLLDNQPVTNITPVAAYGTSLEYLSLTRATVSDLTPVQGLTGLKGFGVMFNGTPVTGLNAISGMTNLENLALSDTPGITSLPDLSLMTKLRSVYISNTGVSDVSTLAGMGDHVQELWAFGTSITDWSPVSYLTWGLHK